MLPRIAFMHRLQPDISKTNAPKAAGVSDPGYNSSLITRLGQGYGEAS
jgi:hypothetical protein